MMRLSLHHLSQQRHPLLTSGNFSIYHETATAHTTSVTASFDLDGICLASRALAAFNVCSFGETRVYTNPKVSDQYALLRKANFFSLDAYEDEEHRRHANFMPGFNFADMPGATLKVVGILKRQADLEAIDETVRGPSRVARTFFAALNRAIEGLPCAARTRRNNISSTGQRYLPSLYRLYPEDIPALSVNIKRAVKSLAPQDLYTFYFVYMKYGQQQVITPHALSVSGLGLDAVIADRRKLEYSSFHLATNFSHVDDRYSLFWDSAKTSVFLAGQRVVRYPFMGLGEVGSITSNFPRTTTILHAWPLLSRDSIYITYAQAYTPLIKPMDTKTPFHDHPFLMSFLLGRRYVQSAREFRHIAECTEGKKEYRALREAIIKQLARATARFEIVVTSRRLMDILHCQLDWLADAVRAERLLVQIPHDDPYRYSMAVVRELFEPLEASYRGALEGSGAVATLLLCESLLSLLPSMNTRDMPYKLLKDYDITPFSSGSIYRERRIVLSRLATVRNGMLFVTQPVVHRVFLPLRQVPAAGRRQVLAMLEFLNSMRTNDKETIVKKAASVLVDLLFRQLVRTQLIVRESVLKSPRVLVQCGGDVHSVISAHIYSRRVFDAEILPREHSLHSFLKTALDLCDREDLYTELACELLSRSTFVPRVTVHESTADISATSFHVLSPATLGYTLNKARTRTLGRSEVTPLLKAAEVTLIRAFDMCPKKSKSITSYSPEKCCLLSELFRVLPVSGQRNVLAVATVGLVEYSMQKGILPRSFSTRQYRRAHNFNRITSIPSIRQAVNRTIVGHTSLLRPFIINVVRII